MNKEWFAPSNLKLIMLGLLLSSALYNISIPKGEFIISGKGPRNNSLYVQRVDLRDQSFPIYLTNPLNQEHKTDRIISCSQPLLFVLFGPTTQLHHNCKMT